MHVNRMLNTERTTTTTTTTESTESNKNRTIWSFSFFSALTLAFFSRICLCVYEFLAPGLNVNFYGVALGPALGFIISLLVLTRRAPAREWTQQECCDDFSIRLSLGS